MGIRLKPASAEEMAARGLNPDGTPLKVKKAPTKKKAVPKKAPSKKGE